MRVRLKTLARRKGDIELGGVENSDDERGCEGGSCNIRVLLLSIFSDEVNY